MSMASRTARAQSAPLKGQVPKPSAGTRAPFTSMNFIPFAFRSRVAVIIKGRGDMVQAPQLEFVFEARVTIAPTVDMGATPRGHQRMIPITGGVVEGPNFRGEVLAGGA